MAHTRPLARQDAHQLAALFSKMFRPGRPADPALVPYLARLYLHDSACSADMPSLVQVSDEGNVYGFIGRHEMPVRLGERALRAAVVSTIMVDPDVADPLAGAKLLRAALSGPQDLSFTETASEVSLRMWRRLGGQGLASYSLDWVRVIRPAGLVGEFVGKRRHSLSFISRFAAPADRRLRRHIGKSELRWWGVREDVEAALPGPSLAEVDVLAFAALFEALTARFSLRPAYGNADLVHKLREAMDKPEFGTPVLMQVRNRAGDAIGGFLYHLKPGESARLIQFLAAEGQEEAVLDSLVSHAAQAGATAVRGRCQPFMLEAMLGRRIAFLNSASSAIHSRDPDVLAAIARGDAFLNGLAGEQWSRLIGGGFG